MENNEIRNSGVLQVKSKCNFKNPQKLLTLDNLIFSTEEVFKAYKVNLLKGVFSQYK